MDRRRVLGIGAAIAAGVLTLLLLTPGMAVGKQSAGEPKPEKYTVCHRGEKLKVTGEAERAEHLGHGDTLGKCPR
jgi:hypothetical protein